MKTILSIILMLAGLPSFAADVALEVMEKISKLGVEKFRVEFLRARCEYSDFYYANSRAVDQASSLNRVLCGNDQHLSQPSPLNAISAVPMSKLEDLETRYSLACNAFLDQFAKYTGRGFQETKKNLLYNLGLAGPLKPGASKGRLLSRPSLIVLIGLSLLSADVVRARMSWPS